ncbi:MAG: DMT family transporter [Rhodospirillaceae bacterium]|nr:DMT family transporter [Rhodospirillaceae bacterium]
MNPGLLGLITALCWGTGDFFARYMSRALGPAHVITFLYAISALVLTPLAMVGNVHLLWEPTTLALSVLSGILSAIGATLLYKSLAQGPLGIVVPVTASYPLPIVLIVTLMGELSITIPLIAAIGITIGGVWVVARIGYKNEYSEVHSIGTLNSSVFYAGSAALVFAVGFLIMEAAVSRAGEVEVIWFSRIIAVIVLIAAIGISSGINIRGIKMKMWLLLITMGIVDSIGFIALFSAHGTGDTAIASVTSAAYGVVTVGLARLILKEPIKALQWVGFAMVFSGAAWLTLISA